MPTVDALLVSIRVVVASVKNAYADKSVTLAEAYEILKTVVQQGVNIATQFADLTGDEKRQAVTAAATELCDFLLARLKLGALGLVLRPIVQALVPVVVDLLIETWVNRAKVRGIGQ